MVSPATTHPWKGQSELAFEGPEAPGWGYDFGTDDSNCDLSTVRQRDGPFVHHCCPSRMHKGFSPFKQIPREQNVTPPDLVQKPLSDKPVTGLGKSELHVDVSSSNGDVSIAPKKSIFFTKYFQGSHSTGTHQHWMKIILGMNASKRSASPLDDSQDRDERSEGGLSKANLATGSSLDLILQNCHTTTRDNNVDRARHRDYNSGSSPVSENHYPIVARDLDGNLSQGHREALSKGMPWNDCSRNDSTDVLDCFVPGGRLMATVASTSRKREHGEEEGATSTTADCYNPSRSGWDRSGLQPPPLCLDLDISPGLQRYPSCSSIDCPLGKSETVLSPAAEDSQGVGDSPHSTQTKLQPDSGLDCQVSQPDSGLCQVCEDTAAGFYCGAFVCEACKKFFIRASKQEKQKFVCLRESRCKITKESRVQCQYCRYQKCLKLSMYYPGEGKRSVNSISVSGIPCRVCGSPSSGFHFGALTCEGCKGFFRRMVKEREPGMYKCSAGGHCEISLQTRNMCKACRYQKCIDIGMSVEGSRIGRQPNAVKHAISLEVKKQRLEKPLHPEHHHYQQSQPSMLTSTAPDSRSRKDGKKGMAKTGDGKIGSTGPRVQGGGGRQSSVSVTCVSSTTSSGLPVSPEATVEVKEEPDSPVVLSSMVLTQVHPEVIVKHEPETDEFDEEIMMAFTSAGKELENMTVVQRAKQDTLDKAEFATYPLLWNKQMKHFDFHAKSVIRFSKKVPGFKDIQLDDKVALVQSSIYPIVVLSHSRSYELETGFYNFFNFTKPEEETTVSMCPSFSMLQSHFKHMGAMAQTMVLTKMEYTLLSSLLLCDPECPGLMDPGQVDQLQARIMNYLQSYEIKSHPDNPTRFGELLLRISELKLASEQHIQVIHNFMLCHPELTLPQMFKEMFF